MKAGASTETTVFFLHKLVWTVSTFELANLSVNPHLAHVIMAALGIPVVPEV